MKTNLLKMSLKVLLLACFIVPGVTFAQEPPMQYFRDPGLAGLNTFETTKADTTPFTGVHVRVGGAFAQTWQTLTDGNYIDRSSTTLTKADSNNFLKPLGAGFNLAMANMTLDAQVADGIRINVTTYLSTRHHEDCWVKNGYLQMDKADFLHSDLINDLFKYLTLDIGDLEVDYGDAHYRRADAGNEMHDPFVENYIMDEFATEIGGEAYFHDPSGVLAMVGITDAQLNPTVFQSNVVDSSTKEVTSYDPAFLAKVGYDHQINEDLRIRLTGSYYGVSNTNSNTLFGGDRAGSHYMLYLVNQSTAAAASSGDANEVFTDGRYNPGFRANVSTFMINPFIKYDGLEFFGTYESANGRASNETDTRNATQLAGDLLYYFGPEQNLWVGVRYNSLDAQQAPKSANLPDVKITRIAGSIGWFLTNTVMMKAEYVDQKFDGFTTGNVLNGAWFKGIVVQACVGF